jgi:Lon protease-like protein
LTSAVRYLSAASAPAAEEADALTQRALALAALARRLRSRPAAASERAALFGQDPTVLAELALKDARRAAVLLPPPPATDGDGDGDASPRPLPLTSAARAEADALFLLERFSDAEAAYLEALSLGPSPEDKAAAEEGLAKARRELGEEEGDDADVGASDQRSPQAAAAAAAAAAASNDDASKPNRRRRGRLARDLDEADCALCAQLLLEPTTTPCGHSFCKSCLSRALDFAPRCPSCRSVLHVSSGQALAVSVTLRALLSASYPEEYARREREAAAAAAEAADQRPPQQRQGERVSLPLFVMTALLPGERMALNIFEPRYRLLIRRCLEGSRRLGTAQGASHHGNDEDDENENEDASLSAPIDGLDRHCTEAEIAECSPQPDGRYHVELVGRRVVRITALSETDGYRVAAGVVVSGAGAGADAPSSACELAALAVRVDARADAWLSRLRAAFSSRGAAARLVDVLERVGRKPALRAATRAAAAAAAAAAGDGDGGLAADEQEQQAQQHPELSPADAAVVAADAEVLSWWAGRLLVVAAPAGGEHADRSMLLKAKGSAERLRIEDRGFEARLASTAGCAVM